MARIVVALRDDNEALEVERTLLGAGCTTTRVRSGAGVLDAVSREHIELCLLDQRLADMSGTELCRELRARAALRALGVMLLVDNDDEIDRIVGFEVGADDVVVKPYSLRELGLRVRAILRRRVRTSNVASPSNVGRLCVDTSSHRVTVDGRPVPLSALELRLLLALFRHRDRVRTRRALLDEVWGRRDGLDTRTVDACVKRLRHKLGDAGHYIQTVRGVGYRFGAAGSLANRAPRRR